MAYKDKEKEKEYKRRYYQEHKDEARKQHKAYVENNRSEFLEKRRVAQREYYKNNKEKCYTKNVHWFKSENATTRQYAINNKARWSEDEERLLIELRQSGLSCSEIAVTLGRTWKSVSYRLNKLHKKQKTGELEAMEELMDLIVAYCLVSKE